MFKTKILIKISLIIIITSIIIFSCKNTLKQKSFSDYSGRIVKMRQVFLNKEIKGLDIIIPKLNNNYHGMYLIFRKTDCTSCINKGLKVINKYFEKVANSYIIDSSLPNKCGMQITNIKTIKDTASVILNQLNNCPTPLLLSIDAKNRIDNLFIIFPHDKPDNIQKLFITNLIKDEE